MLPMTGPLVQMQALGQGLQQGFGLASRGRRLTLSECARAHDTGTPPIGLALHTELFTC